MGDGVDTRALEQAAEEEIKSGLTACQVAVARDNEILWTRSFGSATGDTRFWVASATKPIVSSAIWLLIGDGKLDIARPVAHYVPEFAANEKQDVTVEQVLLMTCGFPDAPMESADGADSTKLANVPKGALVLALVDNASGGLVWMGTATGNVQDAPDDDTVRKRLKYAVAQLMKQVPE